MASFTAVDKDLLRQALGIALQASENGKTGARNRAKFRKIANLLWRAHGEKGTPPPGTGELLIARTELLEIERGDTL
jgi:hypothetical protein